MTIFSPQQLHDLVTTTLPALPEGHTNAIVGTVDQDGAKVVAGFAFDQNRWQFSGAFTHNWTGTNGAGAQLLFSW